MTKARRRLALLGVVLASVVAGAVVPSQASAVLSYYNCVLKPVNQWCDGRANGSYDGQNSWDYNEGWYPGAWDNTVTACQRVWKPSSGGVLGGASCAFNVTWNDYGDVQCTCYDAEVKQQSGGPHSINGRANSSY
jgi:hypothetical protein